MSIYYSSVQIIKKQVIALRAILTKIPAFVESSKTPYGNYMIDENYVLNARVATDMFPLSKQVQVVSDGLKGMVARMTGTEAPKMPDTETTVDELIARLDKTLEFVDSIPELAYESASERKAKLPWMPGKYLTMDDYVAFAIPNTYFHMTTAYNILRHIGLPIGKTDFIGQVNFQDEV